MSEALSSLSQFSDALSGLAAGVRPFLAGVRTKDGHHLSGVLWKPNAVVVSEQALPDASEYEVRIDGMAANAHLAGRDQGTNVAVLRLERDFSGTLPPFANPRLGALALILGIGENGPSARLAIQQSVGGTWQSLAGGTIDHRIILDTSMGRAEEGGPVLAADGTILGISTRGARRQSLVIPAATVNGIVELLLEKGSVERGSLGLALQAVALPETLRAHDSQHMGLMVMEVIAEGPAAKAGIVAGDILLAVDGTAITRPRQIARQLGANSIGRKMEIKFARAGRIVAGEVTIEKRKAG
jgi:S1-C subfamily serine protease